MAISNQVLGTMAVVDRLAIRPAAIEALVDAGMLAILLVPAFFLLVVRPLTGQVSERERSELALQASEQRLLSSLQATRASEARYRLLADHMTDTIWLLDMNLNITYASPSAQKMRGYTPDEIIAMPLEQHLTAGSLQRAREAFASELPRIMADPNYGPRRTLELEHWCKDGTTVWSESTFSVIRDENGNPASILGESREITDRKRAEEAMRDSERRLRTIIDAEPECVKLIDADCRLLDMNPSGLAMIEAESAEQVKGRCVLDLIAPEYHASYRAGVAAALGGNSVTQTFEMVGLQGTRRWMEQSAVRLAYSKGPDQVLAITRDVTDRKRSEDALQQSATMLEAAQRIGGLGSYVLDVASGTWTSSGVLHDIFGIGRT